MSFIFQFTLIHESERVNDNLSIRPGVPVYRSILSLSKLEELNNGSYFCKVTNEHGSAISPHSYIIKVEPGKQSKNVLCSYLEDIYEKLLSSSLFIRIH